MKTFTSVRGLAFALLLVGGSVQAVTWADLYRPSTPATSTLTLVQNKSFFASHPVLKWGGISLATVVVAGLVIEGWKAHNAKIGLGAQLTADYNSILSWIQNKMSKKSQVEQKTSVAQASSSASINSAPATTSAAADTKACSSSSSSCASSSSSTAATVSSAAATETTPGEPSAATAAVDKV